MFNNKQFTRLIYFALIQVFLISSASWAEPVKDAETLRVPIGDGERIEDTDVQLPEDEELIKIADNIFGIIKKYSENIRNPNRLCGWIVNFLSPVKDDAVPYRVLKYILDKVNQTQYADSYVKAMQIKMEKLRKKRKLSLDAAGMIEDDWNVIDTEGFRKELALLKPLNSFQQIPVEEVTMSPLGHGIMSSHDSKELSDLHEAMIFINKLVSKNYRMGEKEIAYPVIIEGENVLSGEKRKIIRIEDSNFIIEAFKDKIVISAEESSKIRLFFNNLMNVEHRAFSGRCSLGGQEFMFSIDLYKGKIVLMPIHEILELHKIISRNLGVNMPIGDGRRSVVGGVYRGEDGFRDYLFYSMAKDIPELMERYFEWLKREEEKIESKDQSAMHPVELAAQAFHKLLCIHPFENGNTRTASLVMNYILMKNGFPPFILNKANEKEFYAMERFCMNPTVSIWLEKGSDFDERTAIDGSKVLSFYSAEYTAFLVREIKKSISQENKGTNAITENIKEGKSSI